MKSGRPFVKVSAGAIVLAALISLVCPSRISIKPVFILAAIGLALVRCPTDKSFKLHMPTALWHWQHPVKFSTLGPPVKALQPLSQGFWLLSVRMASSIQEQQKLHHSQLRRMKEQQNDLLDKVEGLQTAVCRDAVSDKS